MKYNIEKIKSKKDHTKFSYIKVSWTLDYLDAFMMLHKHNINLSSADMVGIFAGKEDNIKIVVTNKKCVLEMPNLKPIKLNRKLVLENDGEVKQILKMSL